MKKKKRRRSKLLNIDVAFSRKNAVENILITAASIVLVLVMHGFQKNLFLVDDNYTQFAPIIQEAFTEFIHTGKMPVYDFYQMKGMLIADEGYYGLTNGMMLIAFFITRLCPVWNVLEAYSMICICMGNAGMNCLLKKLRFGLGTRIVMLFMYAGSSAFLYFGYWYYIFNNYIVMPYLLWAVIAVFDERKAKRKYVCAGMVLFFSCSLGNMQYTFYHYLVFGLMGILLVWMFRKSECIKILACNIGLAVFMSGPFLIMAMQAGKRRSMYLSPGEFLEFSNPIIQQIILSFIPMPLFQKLFGEAEWYEAFTRQGSFSENGYWFYYCGFLMLALAAYILWYILKIYGIRVKDLRQFKKCTAREKVAVLAFFLLLLCLTRDAWYAGFALMSAAVVFLYFATRGKRECRTAILDDAVKEKWVLAVFGTAVFFIMLGVGKDAVIANVFAVLPVVKGFRYLFKTVFIIIPLLVPVAGYIFEKAVKGHIAAGYTFAACFIITGIYNNYYIASSGEHAFFRNYDMCWTDLDAEAENIGEICSEKGIEQNAYRFCTFADPEYESDSSWSCYGDTLFQAGKKLVRNTPTLAHCFSLGGYDNSWMDIGYQQSEHILRMKDYEYSWINAIAAKEFFNDVQNDPALYTEFMDDVLKNNVKYFLFNENSAYIELFKQLTEWDERISIESDTAFTEGMRLIGLSGVERIGQHKNVWIDEMLSMEHIVLQAEKWDTQEPVTLSFTWQENMKAYYYRQNEKVYLDIRADEEGFIELMPKETLLDQKVHVTYESLFYSSTVMYMLVISVALFFLFAGVVFTQEIRKDTGV